MSLILKTDVKYTGVVAARHILEFLNTPTEKTVYLKRMLSDINADSSYVTDATSPNITTKLLAHIKRVQLLGASVLSINYTLKAIIFVIKNNLSDADYTSFSADFGSELDASSRVIKVHTLDGSALSPIGSAPPPLQVKNIGGVNVMCQQDGSALGGVLADDTTSQSINLGLIVGQCLSTVDNGSRRFFELRDGALFNTILWLGTTPLKTSSASNVSLLLPVTGATQAGGKSVVSSGNGSDYFHKKGIVAKYEYGTVNNKLFVSGSEKIANTGTDTCFDMSSYGVQSYVSSASQQSGVIEAWVINSKNDSLANALSIHLNRQ